MMRKELYQLYPIAELKYAWSFRKFKYKLWCNKTWYNKTS